MNVLLNIFKILQYMCPAHSMVITLV